MDVNKITELTIVALTQFASSSAGENDPENLEHSNHILDIVEQRFAREIDSYASQTLQRFLQKPESRQAALKESLAELLIEDSSFAQKLSNAFTLVQKNSATQFSTTVTGGNVGQIMNIDTMHGDLVIGEKASGRTSITGNKNRLDKSNTTYDQRGQVIKGDQTNVAGNMNHE